LFLPVGGNFTIGGDRAAAIARTVEPRLVVPMHYGNSAVDFLEPPDAFLDALGAPVDRLDDGAFDVELGDELRVVMPAVP
jgi:L-ascorbate metabolism protein UlaG (beta-lactamase superfamily)